MNNQNPKHWFNDYRGYWAVYLLMIAVQAGLTVSQLREPTFAWYLIFYGAFLIINAVVAVIILLLTWPARRNLDFSRYIKILIAFSAVYVLSQLLAVLIAYLQG